MLTSSFGDLLGLRNHGYLDVHERMT